MGADCKSADSVFDGSNPSLPTKNTIELFSRVFLCMNKHINCAIIFLGIFGGSMKEITLESLAKLKKDYLKDDKNYILQNALSTCSVEKVISKRRLREFDTKMMFSHEVKTHSITNQKASGRCWMFAGCNLLREEIIKKLELKDFELSQSYLAFYDKIEKFNNDVRVLIDLVEKQYEEKGKFSY